MGCEVSMFAIGFLPGRTTLDRLANLSSGAVGVRATLKQVTAQLDDVLAQGAVTYAVGFTTVRYLEKNQELSADEIRAEFRARFKEGTDRLQEQARERSAELSTELSTEIRSRYETAARQLKEGTDTLREQARQRSIEIRSRYETAVRQARRSKPT